MIRLAREFKANLVLTADAVVVGLGAGGSMMLRELARSGLSVIGVEEGGNPRPKDFSQREEEMIPLLFQEAGGRTTEDLAIRVVQGKGIGGSTIHNTNLCKRIPDEILRLWSTAYGVKGITPDDLRPLFESVERDLSVSEIPEELQNRNNQVLRKGAEALGYRGARLKHNRVGCQGSGFCELGCAYNAKQNAQKILIPQAEEHGAQIIADVRVDRVLHENGIAVGIEGVTLDAVGRVTHAITVRTPVVVLAGSAVGSAALALRSELRDPHNQIGRHLRMHPGAVAAGRFTDAVYGAVGIPQSYECTELLSFDPKDNRRVWIVPAFAHPVATASMLPGFGKSHMTLMRSYAHLSVLTAMLHDESEGQVSLKEDGSPLIRYRMNESDRNQLADGLIATSRILFAAGAAEVVIPAIPSIVLKRKEDIEHIDRSRLVPSSVPLTAVHPMGTMRMGEDPKASATNSEGEHHHTKGLFVADGSLFPTSIGGPPQIGIYTLALHVSKFAAARAKQLKK